MAPSAQSDALAELFKEFASQFPQDNNHYIERCIYDQVHPAASEATGIWYEDVKIGGRLCKWVRPQDATSSRMMLFFHGGGFSFGSPNGHRKLAAHLAKACGIVCLMVDYRLSPEHVYPAALEDCVRAYEWALEHTFSGDQIILAGDSCGGGQVTSVPLALAERGLPNPAASISLSPWYDLTGSGETMNTNEQNDVLKTKPFVAMIADRYTKGAAKEDPLISPLFASNSQLENLPPHWISVGGYDMLRDDGERFAEKLKNAGVELVLEVQEEQQHVCEFMVGKAPEANRSIERIAEWTRKKLRL